MSLAEARAVAHEALRNAAATLARTALDSGEYALKATAADALRSGRISAREYTRAVKRGVR